MEILDISEKERAIQVNVLRKTSLAEPKEDIPQIMYKSVLQYLHK